MRTSDKKLNPVLKAQIERLFIQTLNDLKSPKEVEIFLKSFFTESELETFAKRLAIAYWLRKGRSYANIKENIKVSSATVATIQAALNRKGIEMAMRKIEAEEWANQWSEKIKKIVGK